MMVMLRYTGVANTAMLASGRFEKMARATDLPWFIQYMVVRIATHFHLVVLWGNYGTRRRHALVSEDVG